MRPLLDDESRALRREIMNDVGSLLRDELSAESWGRLLVEVVRDGRGEPIVAGIDVEEVLCDDARLDAVFRRDELRAVLPVVAKAVEALCGLDGVDLDEVRGGTFVRRPEEGFAWLPALVHAPSASIDAERESLVRALRAKSEALEARFGFPSRGRPDVDLARERLQFVVDGRAVAEARATLLGTFAPSSRTWGWGGSHPNVPEAVRRASAAVVDAVVDRSPWELTTPVFATDEATAWALAAFVVERSGADGVLCNREGDGLVFLLLREFRSIDER